MLKKIVVLGPESTGKSTLCQQLAAHYHTYWCPEFAREYLMRHGTAYSFPDLLTIAKGQLEQEDEFAQQATEAQKQLLIVDTDMQVMKVWCEFVFGDCHTWILNQAAERIYHHYLLCAPDLPWVHDELREYPAEGPRQQLFHMYQDAMVQQKVPWTLVEGNYEQRFAIASSVIV